MATNAGEENAIMANQQLIANQPTTATAPSNTMAGEPTLAQWKARCLAAESRGNAGVMAEQLKAIDLHELLWPIGASSPRRCHLPMHNNF
jgi:hypothetical protein